MRSAQIAGQWRGDTALTLPLFWRRPTASSVFRVGARGRALIDFFKQDPLKQAPFKQAPFKQDPLKQAPFKQDPLKRAPFKQAPFKQDPFKQDPFKQDHLALPLQNRYAATLSQGYDSRGENGAFAYVLIVSDNDLLTVCFSS